jgi:predicted metal-dependent enzyme (double-stranded beta helix superfamily)
MPADKTPILPAARRLTADIRMLYERGLDETELWRQIAAAMRHLLLDAALRQRAQAWPTTVEGSGVAGNLLLYEDPQYGFVFNATVRKPNTVSNVHDHGKVWTLYGLIEGREIIYRYERVNAGTDSDIAHLKLVSRHMIGPGDIDVVAPGDIHQEQAGAERSIAFIVRGRRPGTFLQRQYDLATGAAAVSNGPRQLEERL